MNLSALGGVAVVDLILGFVLLASIVIGIVRGFIKEMLSLVAWGLAFWIAYRYSAPASEWLDSFIGNPTLSSPLGSIGVFVASLLILSLAGNLLSRLFKRSGLTGTDRLLGAVFGTGRGLAILIATLVILRLTPLIEQPWYNASWLTARSAPLVDSLVAQVGGSLIESVESTVIETQGSIVPAPLD